MFQNAFVSALGANQGYFSIDDWKWPYNGWMPVQRRHRKGYRYWPAEVAVMKPLKHIVVWKKRQVNEDGSTTTVSDNAKAVINDLIGSTSNRSRHVTVALDCGYYTDSFAQHGVLCT